MNEIPTYKDALNAVKRGFLIIGLTGYTGAGCSTVRRMLDSAYKPIIPVYSSLNEICSELEHRKLKRAWDKVGWNPFIPIKFSCIIFAFVMRKALFEESLGHKDHLREVHELGKFYKDKLKGLEFLTNRREEIEKNAQDLMIAYQCISELYKKFSCDKEKNILIKSMQQWGDEIRQRGDVHLKDDEKHPVHPKAIACLPEAVRRVMKAYRISGNNRFCIDAFRNSYEVEYFQRRYSEFYLVHVTRDREYRRSSLGISSEKERDELEEREKGNRIDKRSDNIHEWFPSQNVDECAQKADVFFNNIEDKQHYLHYHLIRLLALAHQPGCVPPTEDERSMQIAMTARQMSGCISRQVGAVVVAPSGFVVGVGWNDPPKNQVSCSLRTGAELVNDPPADVFSDFELSDKFRNHMKKENCKDEAFCFKDEYTKMEKKGKKVEYTRALHAEENAFLQATDHSGGTLQGSILYSTTLPCMLCAKKSYHLGVKRIVYIDSYPDIAIDQVIQAGKEENRPKVVPFEGATGSAYFRLFTPIVPEKDWNTIYAETGTERDAPS